MLLVALFIQVVVQVLCEAPLPSPQDIHVNNWLLTWTPASEEQGITYTVQYRSFNTIPWKDVPACLLISRNSCNVTFLKAEGELGCVKLQVLAKTRLLTSTPVEACSRHGDSCTPAVSLTARPGSLTVHLSRNHALALEHGDHAKHRVYYGKEGEPMQEFGDTTSSVSIPELQEGQRYCAEVQYIYFSKPVGPPSCIQCEIIPESKKDLNQTEIIVIVVVVVVLLLLMPVAAYILIFQQGRIKQWLRPPYQIPDYFLEPFPDPYNPISSSPTGEHYDVISFISPEEFRE